MLTLVLASNGRGICASVPAAVILGLLSPEAGESSPVATALAGHPWARPCRAHGPSQRSVALNSGQVGATGALQTRTKQGLSARGAGAGGQAYGASLCACV